MEYRCLQITLQAESYKHAFFSVNPKTFLKYCQELFSIALSQE